MIGRRAICCKPAQARDIVQPDFPSFNIAPPVITDFENFQIGTANGQFDWKSLGAAGQGCAVYDHAIVANIYGYASFGGKSLRMSNAVTSGCFGDQTFSGRTANPAGEMTDTPTGLEVNFFDVQGTSNPANFVESNVASKLDRTVPHPVRITMDLFDGPSNDVVKVHVDGVLLHTGTSWENYYRYDSEQTPAGNLVPIVNRILFRTGGSPAPLTAGKGFLVDNLLISTFTVATAKDACKKNGWMNLSRSDGSSFKNQGDCIQYVNTGK